MVEYEFALDVVKFAPLTHPSPDFLKKRLEHLDNLRDSHKTDLNPKGEWLITRAIISTSIDLGNSYEALRRPARNDTKAGPSSA